MQDAALFVADQDDQLGAAEERSLSGSRADATVAAASSPPRVRRPDRAQALIQPTFLEHLLADDHLARLVDRVVGRLDLSSFYARIEARGSRPGRSATDPALLVSLVLYATMKGIGCGREIARLCLERDDFRWLCGGVNVNYHTINDFRVEHGEALDDLLTSVLVTLASNGVVQFERLSQDGVRIRACAGTNTFRSTESTKKLLKKAKRHVQRVKAMMDPGASARQQKARERAARERVERLEKALQELPKIEAARQRWARGDERKKKARASHSDPEARYMKMPNGGSNPAYNVQLAADPVSRAIVGVDVSNEGSDAHLSAPMRQQVRRRLERIAEATGESPAIKEQVLDGGYADIEEVKAAEKEGVTLIVPPRKRTTKPGDDLRTGVREGDPPEVVAWRQRMASDESKMIYGLRGQTSETINADLTAHRTLSQIRVRGANKVRCIALWNALAYNLLQFMPALLT